MKLTMNQQCALVAKKANGILGCIRKTVTSKLRDIIPSLYSALVRHIWSARSSAGLPNRRDIDILERVQWRTTEMVKGLGYLAYKERLRDLGLFNLEKRLREILSMWRNTWFCSGGSGIKKAESDSSQCCPVTGQEAIGVNWTTGNSI